LKTFTTSVLLLLLAAGAARAQAPKGAVSGTVLDAATKEPLVGVNVLVKGTVLGAATDRSGHYSIHALRPGTYQLEFSSVGYERRSVEAEVVAGSVTTLDAELSSVSIQFDQIVVTATRRETAIEEVPVSVATVTADDIAYRNTVTLDDALRYVPGVNMMLDQVNIRGSSGYSRGVGTRVLLLLDGLPYLTGDTGEISWEVIPVQQIDKIEVVKGAGSALYGSSALGGVINVLTKEIPEEPSIRFRLYGAVYDQPGYDVWRWYDGTRGKAGAILDVSGKTGDLGYLVSVSRTIDDSYRSTDAYHRWGLYTKLQYDFSPTQRLMLTGNVLNRLHENYFWWESLEKPLLVHPNQVNGHVRSNRGNISLDYRESVSDRLIYTVKGIYYGNAWKDDSAGVLINDSKSHLVHAEVQLTYQIAKGNYLTTGMTAAVDKVSSNLFRDQTGSSVAVYAQDEFSLASIAKLTAGIRYDRGKVSGIDPAGRFSPTLGATVTVSPGWTLRASVGTGFRYPSIAELHIASPANVTGIAVVPNLELKPERSVTAEVGIAGLAGGVGQFDLALFQTELRDLIEPTVFVAQEPYVQFQNVTKARIQGAETGFRTGLPKLGLALNLGYTYIWAREIDSLGGELPLKFRPRHLLNAGLVWTEGEFRAGLDYRYNSRIERIDENLSRIIPDGDARVPVHVVDLRFSYGLSRLGMPLTIGLDVNNLLNYYYVELTGNMSPIRSYLVSLEGSF
jgi:outer membrane receptor for ferrienterochelin and colicins